MTDSDNARIAVLESKVEILTSTLEKMSTRQDAMYELMMQSKGGWKTLALIGGVCMALGGLGVSILTFLGK